MVLSRPLWAAFLVFESLYILHKHVYRPDALGKLRGMLGLKASLILSKYHFNYRDLCFNSYSTYIQLLLSRFYNNMYNRVFARLFK